MNADKKEKQRSAVTIWFLLPLSVMMFGVLYLIARTVLFLFADHAVFDRIAALLVLFAESLILLHGFGYMRQLWRVHRITGGFNVKTNFSPVLNNYPPVVVVMPSYKEPLEILELTLSCAYTMTYPEKHIILLDDTRYDIPDAGPSGLQSYKKDVEDLCEKMGVNLFRRNWRGAKAGIINDFISYLYGKKDPGFSLQSFAFEPLPDITPKYIAIFDADQQPMPGFLEPLVAQMEDDAKMAFVQTPQYYTNFGENRIARAAGLQQVVFFEFICQGKSVDDAMFCCGTNVLFRLDALQDIGGLREDSVTEDFATSFILHQKGWRSSYQEKTNAFGMGPEDLSAYFKQQFRWALGSTGLLPTILKKLFTAPRSFPPIKWLEYILSSSYYLTGMAIVVMMSLPMLYIFFNVPAYFMKPEIYALFFIPYFMLSMFTFYWVLGLRGYKTQHLIEGQLLLFLSFPIYIKASLMGIAGVKGRFQVTPKKGGCALPWRFLKVHLFFMLLNLAAISWGINRLYYEDQHFWAIIANISWCFYHFMVLCSMYGNL